MPIWSFRLNDHVTLPIPGSAPMMTITIQIFGLAMIAFALFCFYRTMQRTKAGWIRTILVVIILVGASLLFHHRITQMKVLGIASITAAQERAQTGSKQIDSILERIEGQAATVDAIAKQAADAKHISEEVQKKNQQADERLKSIDEALKRGKEAVSELQAYTAFNNIVLAAQNGDRPAFDRLRAWAKDKTYSFEQAAQQA